MYTGTVEPLVRSYNIFSMFLQYHTDVDVGFSSSLACSLMLLFLIGGLQAIILPRTIILLLLFLTAFIWISVSSSYPFITDILLFCLKKKESLLFVN